MSTDKTPTTPLSSTETETSDAETRNVAPNLIGGAARPFIRTVAQTELPPEIEERVRRFFFGTFRSG